MIYYIISLKVRYPKSHENIHLELYYYTNKREWREYCGDDSRPEDWQIDNKNDAQRLFNELTFDDLIKNIPTLKIAREIEAKLYECSDYEDELLESKQFFLREETND